MEQARRTPVGQRLSTDLLTQGIAAARTGQRIRARHLFTRLVDREPDHEQAWIWLASLSKKPRQAQAYLRQALRVNPRNRRAIRALRHIDAQLAFSEAASPTPKWSQARALRRWLGIWLLVAAAIVILGGFVTQAWVAQSGNTLVPGYGPAFVLSPSATATVTATPTPDAPQRIGEQLPHLQQAWESRDWKTATDVLNDITLLDYDYPGLRAARCDTYLHWARDLVSQSEIKQAYALYRQAGAYCEDLPVVREEKSLALRYLSGRWRYDNERWQEAANTLQAVYDVDPDYADTRSLLYASYVASSRALLAENHLHQAQGACQAALRLNPESSEATALLNQIRAMLTPTPTPTPSNPLRKRIEVNISKQRMYVWQGDTLLYNWVISTGEPGRGTATGHYRVLDKIPEAWASTWSLRMPYWLGIYYVGSLENGFHALPILPNGQTLWVGYLGSPVSYGCIILGTENARMLYHWADIGTPVWIHY